MYESRVSVGILGDKLGFRIDSFSTSNNLGSRVLPLPASKTFGVSGSDVDIL